MSVVRGPWIAINVPMPVRGPWSVDWLLALAKTVRGWLAVRGPRQLPRTATVYDTTGTKCGAVNVAQLNFIVHFKNATAQARQSSMWRWTVRRLGSFFLTPKHTQKYTKPGFLKTFSGNWPTVIMMLNNCTMSSLMAGRSAAAAAGTTSAGASPYSARPPRACFTAACAEVVIPLCV